MSSISDYNDLVSEIAIEFSRSDTGARAPRSIQMLEAELNRRLRVLDMITSTTIDTVADTETIDMPSDFRAIRSIALASTPQDLTPLSLEKLINAYAVGTTGRPRFFSLLNQKVRFAPIPDGVYTVNLSYYGNIPALTSLNTTNWLIEKHPDLYLYGSCEKLAMIYKDTPMRDYYGALKDALIADIDKEDGGVRLGESTPYIAPEGTIV